MTVIDQFLDSELSEPPGTAGHDDSHIRGTAGSRKRVMAESVLCSIGIETLCRVKLTFVVRETKGVHCYGTRTCFILAIKAGSILNRL